MKTTLLPPSLTMKSLLIAGLLIIQLCCYAQDTLRPRRAGENTFTFAVERGGTVDFDPGIITINSTIQITPHNSYGLSTGYTHSFPVRNRSEFALGIGINATMFSSHIIYRNPDVDPYYYNGNDTFEIRVLRSHDIGKVTNMFIAMDFQALYSVNFPVRSKWTIAPYAGVKLRNVVYIRGEERYHNFGVGVRELSGTDTIFYINPDISYRMRDSRLIIMPTIGVSVKKPLENGGKFGLFADYSYGIANHVQIDYKGFDNTEQMEVTHTDAQGSTTYLQEFNIDYIFDHPLVLALNMSHIRVGVSYTLPDKRR